jgi:hypothetical protein
MSVEIIEQVTSFSEYMQETSILPKAKNGYWTVSKTKNLKTERFEYHYEYHIEYKDEEDCLQNFTLFNKDFVSGLKQLGLTEEKIIEKRIKTIYYENGVETENCVEIPKRTQKMRDNYPALRDKWQENLDSLKIIQRLPLSIEDIPDINIVPKAKNGYWTVSETNAFDKIKYYDYHIEYKSLRDCDHNFRIKNEDFVSGLKQLGLTEEKIIETRLKIIYYKNGVEIPKRLKKWQENPGSIKIIQRLPLSIEDIPDINIVPKAKNGYWTVSETNAFDKIKYYDYHIEYKGVKDLEQNFRIGNEDFVSGLKQLGLNEYEICFPRSRNKCYEKGAITIYMN